MTNTCVVTVGKQKKGFTFGMLTLQIFSDHTGVEFGEIIEHLSTKPINSIIILLMAANTVYEEGRNGSVSKFDVDKWISLMSPGDYQKIMDCWAYSMEQLIEKLLANKEGSKKK